MIYVYVECPRKFRDVSEILEWRFEKVSNFTVAMSEIADGRSPVSEVESDDKAKAEGAARPSVKQFQDSKRKVATLD